MNPFLFVAIKLLIGFLAMTLIINITGKGNLHRHLPVTKL